VRGRAPRSTADQQPQQKGAYSCPPRHRLCRIPRVKILRSGLYIGESMPPSDPFDVSGANRFGACGSSHPMLYPCQPLRSATRSRPNTPQ
jgi:hypothetical protein